MSERAVANASTVVRKGELSCSQPKIDHVAKAIAATIRPIAQILACSRASAVTVV